jgi:hypothetical protein
MEYYQQGDVLLKKLLAKPTVDVKLKTDLLHKGQAHHHRLRGKFKIATQGNVRYVHSKGAELYHEEHQTIFIPEGFYVLDLVREYDHFLEESRIVVD